MFGNVKEFGLYLKEKRVAVKMSQNELAAKLGYSCGQYVSNWERGTAPAPQEKFIDLINILKINTEEFVSKYISLEEKALKELLSSKKN